jgi:Flp pilus assembly protein TadG
MGTPVLNFRNIKRLLSNRGQSIVEISLITPLVLVALYIPTDFGIAYYTAHLTQNAVREATRIAVSTKDPFDSTAGSAIASEAMSRIPARLNSVTVTVQYFGPASATCMQTVSVTAQGTYFYFFYQFLRMLGFPAPDAMTTPPIIRTTQMRYEFQPVTNLTPSCVSPTLTSTASRA